MDEFETTQIYDSKITCKQLELERSRRRLEEMEEELDALNTMKTSYKMDKLERDQQKEKARKQKSKMLFECESDDEIDKMYTSQMRPQETRKDELSLSSIEVVDSVLNATFDNQFDFEDDRLSFKSASSGRLADADQTGELSYDLPDPLFDYEPADLEIPLDEENISADSQPGLKGVAADDSRMPSFLFRENEKSPLNLSRLLNQSGFCVRPDIPGPVSIDKVPIPDPRNLNTEPPGFSDASEREISPPALHYTRDLNPVAEISVPSIGEISLQSQFEKKIGRRLHRRHTDTFNSRRSEEVSCCSQYLNSRSRRLVTWRPVPNRHKMKAALSKCLEGKNQTPLRNLVLEVFESCSSTTFLILFRGYEGRHDFRGLYHFQEDRGFVLVNIDLRKYHNLWCPQTLAESLVDRPFRFDCSRREYVENIIHETGEPTMLGIGPKLSSLAEGVSLKRKSRPRPGSAVY